MADAQLAVAPRFDSADRTRRRYALVALAAAALTLVVIVASAFMRHAQAGLSCDGWPACYARATGAGDAQVAGVAVARSVHRTAATGVSLAVLAMLAIGWREPALRRLAVGAIAVVAMLSAIGLATPGARLPAVPLANLLGGAGLLAILAAAHASASGVKAASRGVRIAAAIAVALVLVQAFLGGSVAAHSALLACPAFPGCDGVTWSAFASGGAWNPLRAPAIVDEHIVAPAGAGALHLLHRIGAIVLAALVLAIVATLWRPRGGLASALGIVLASALAAGIAAALVPSSLGATLVHNAAAALLVALLARAAVGPAERAYARTTMSGT